MNVYSSKAWRPLGAALVVAVCLYGAYARMAGAGEIAVTLSGDQEEPPVKTTASGSGTITIGADMSVSGKVTTTGVVATAAHIHEGAAGANGPVIIPLAKSGENTWTVPAGAKLSAGQYASFEAGKLYVNVHSAAHKGGEIRAQLKP